MVPRMTGMVGASGASVTVTRVTVPPVTAPSTRVCHETVSAIPFSTNGDPGDAVAGQRMAQARHSAAQLLVQVAAQVKPTAFMPVEGCCPQAACLHAGEGGDRGDAEPRAEEKRCRLHTTDPA